ncbi:MAG: DUF3192 domain-containing protein [Idiomarina sp.]|nr:DUF3192 domain-containing protein [Idiomarina sp.]
MNTKTLSMALLAVPLAMSLTACMVVVDGNKSSSAREQRQESWQAIEERNRRNIATLSHGQSAQTVLETMGEADFDENIRINETQYRVLYYRTQRVKADGMTTKDECTPIVFRDDELYGWGENQLKVLLSPAD